MRGGNLVRSELRCQDRGADVFKQTSLRDDVANVRNVVQRDGSDVSKAAAMHGSAEFLAPLIETLP